MYLKDIIDRNIAINCRTEEEARNLCEYLIENGINTGYLNNDNTCWETYKENSCYVLEKTNWGNVLLIGDKKIFKLSDYKIITLDDLDDFKQTKETIELFKDYIPISFAFNKTKKKIYLKYFGKEIRVKCDEKDKFEWKIGLGLALYRAYQKLNDVKYMKKNYNYKKLAEYCLYKFYNFDENKIKDLEDRVNNSKENTLIRL